MTEMLPDEKEIYDKMARVRVVNSELAAEIEQMGGAVDVSVARLEHMYERLVELGVISRLQMLTEQFDWEMSLKSQLIPIRDHHVASLKKAHADQQAKKRKKELWVPNGQG